MVTGMSGRPTIDATADTDEVEYLEALADVLVPENRGSAWTTLGMTVAFTGIRLRPGRRNRRAMELQALFALSDLPECTFAIRLGAGPARNKDVPNEWAEEIAVALEEAFATKKRLPRDCVAAADAEGVTWF